jgi:hypothetical protein
MARSRRPTDFSTKPAEEVLIPATPPASVPFTPLLDVEAEEPAWRLIDFYSVGSETPPAVQLPFLALVTWTSGRAAARRPELKMDIPGIARLCVFARKLAIRVTNVVPTPPAQHRVGCYITDALWPTRNSYSVALTSLGATPVALTLPPYAQRVRLFPTDPVTLSLTDIRLLHQAGATPHTVLRADQQPPEGLVLGPTGVVEILGPLNAVYRLAFLLEV